MKEKTIDIRIKATVSVNGVAVTDAVVNVGKTKIKNSPNNYENH